MLKATADRENSAILPLFPSSLLSERNFRVRLTFAPLDFNTIAALNTFLNVQNREFSEDNLCAQSYNGLSNITFGTIT